MILTSDCLHVAFLHVSFLSLVVCPELCVGRSYFPWPQPQGLVIILYIATGSFHYFVYCLVWPVQKQEAIIFFYFFFSDFVFVDSNSNVLHFNQDCIPKIHLFFVCNQNKES